MKQIDKSAYTIMNIVYIVHTRIPTEKAYGYQVSKVCEELSRAGAHVALWAPQQKNTIVEGIYNYYGIEQNFTIRYIPTLFSSGFSNRLMFALHRITYLMALFFYNPGRNSVIYTRSPEIAWLFTIRGFETAYSAHNWPRSSTRLFVMLLKKVYLIVCNTKGTEQAYNAHGLVQTVVIPNGVDISNFQLSQTKDECRTMLDLPIEKKIIMYTGHLYAWKGIDTVIELAHYMTEDLDVLFVIVGGTEEDRERYVNSIESRDLRNVRLCGHVNRAKIPLYLKSADVLLLPNSPTSEESVRYTSPIKMFEYMASGTPILASDLPSLRETLNKKNALFAEAGNSEKFAEGVRLLLNDIDLSRSLGDQALRDVKEYTWEKHAKRLLHSLHEIVTP